MNIVITFKVDNKYKDIIDSMLVNYANVIYLPTDTNKREEILKSSDILFAWNIRRELNDEEFNYLKQLKFLQLLSAGADRVPYHLLDKNIVIASNVGAYAKPMAEHILAMILALAKSLLENHQKLKEGIFDQYRENKSLENSVCGILGFGGIGWAAAKLLKAFNTKIYAINTSGKTNEKVDFIGNLQDLNYVLKQSDIVVISLPLNKYTKALIDEKRLNIMKKDAILINVARGEIIVEEDLFKHLKNNPNFKAGIDVWWIEPFVYGEFKTHYNFFDLPNFIGSPHNAAVTSTSLQEALIDAIINIKNYLQGFSIKGIVKREDYI